MVAVERKKGKALLQNEEGARQVREEMDSCSEGRI